MSSTTRNSLPSMSYEDRPSDRPGPERAVSITQHLESNPSRASGRPLGPFHTRSEGGANFHRYRIQTIEEDIVANTTSILTNVAVRDSASLQQRQYKTTTDSADSVGVSQAPSSPSILTRDAAQSSQNERHNSPTSTDSITKPPRRPRPGHRWSRSKSGGIWYERLGASSTSQKSSRQSHESRSESQNSVPRNLLIPLAPPKLSKTEPEGDTPNLVKVEIPFGSPPKVLPTSYSQKAGSSATSGSRHSSIRPLQIFSSPLRLKRFFSQSKQKLRSQVGLSNNLTNRRQDHHHGNNFMNHDTVLVRKRTSEALRRVASILQGITRVGSNSNSIHLMRTNRSQSNKSVSSNAFQRANSQPIKVKQGITYNAALYNQTSFQDLHDIPSFTSTQLDLQLAVEPNNTPEERATYKVKRSASVETEDFLKIDISIRGETSYLQSEARRIHTPRLPQTSRDGKRRGFFFDYNAPEANTIPPLKLDITRSDTIKSKQSLNPSSIPARSTSRAATIGRSGTIQKVNISERTRTGDWYDAKLEELDSSSSDESNPMSATRLNSVTTLTSLSEIRKAILVQQLDHNIPEHLPNSPLCPRHPKYWRVVQNRGSQFRGCWMHGIGEYGT